MVSRERGDGEKICGAFPAAVGERAARKERESESERESQRVRERVRE